MGSSSSEGKACGARVHLEEVRLDDTPVELRLNKGEVTILNSRTKGPVKLIAVPLEGNTRSSVKAFVNCCNVDRDFQAEGLASLTVRGNAISGNVVGFKDCADLTFDGNVVRSPSVHFEVSESGGFKKTIIQKSDIHGGALIFKAPRAATPVDKIPVDKCWFQGRTKEKEILGRTRTRRAARSSSSARSTTAS